MNGIAPKIIYKQQHVGGDGKKYSASRNSSYVKYIGERVHVLKESHETNLVEYIGEREHAAKTEEAQNGLFGYIGGKFSDNLDTEEMQRYVAHMTTPYRNVYHSIFSFTPQSCDEAGLHSLSDWEDWVKYHISDIAKGNNVRLENVEYLAAVHMKRGQPHVHIMWWDKEQQILINKVDPLACDKVRILATKSTYKAQFTELYNLEEIKRRELRKGVGKALNNLPENDKFTQTVGMALHYISDILPTKGQLKYAFVNDEVKQSLNKLTHYIIENNAELKKQFDEICALRQTYNEMLHGDSNYGEYLKTTFMYRVLDSIDRAVGNEILRTVKAMRKNAGWSEIHYSEPVDLQTDKWAERFIATDKIRRKGNFKKASEAAKQGNYEEALKLYKAEADKGNVLAKYEIGDLYRRGLLKGDNADKYYKDALDGFMRMELDEAVGGNSSFQAYIQYRIGRMYYDGYGTEKDAQSAFDWLKKSADGGNRLSQLMVGKMLLNGDGTTVNSKKAIEYLRQAAEENSSACYLLGKLYLRGSGDIPKNPKLGIDFMERAKGLNKGIAPYADYAIGCAYLYDSDIRDAAMAQKYLSLAASEGSESAQTMLDSKSAQAVANLVVSVGRLISTNLDNSRAAMSEKAAKVFGRGDMSLEQIRELLLKLSDKENINEM